jgi:hypothetical protein
MYIPASMIAAMAAGFIGALIGVSLPTPRPLPYTDNPRELTRRAAVDGLWIIFWGGIVVISVMVWAVLAFG